MARSTHRGGALRWCHVVWPTFRRRELFKIPAAARFCERAVRDCCSRCGWTVDTIAITNCQIHLLMRAPAAVQRSEIIRVLQRQTATALRHRGLAPRWERRLWDEWAWCGVLSSATSVLAVRRWLVGRRAARFGLWGWQSDLASWPVAHDTARGAWRTSEP